MSADWDAVLAEGERLLRAWAGNQPVEREWRLWVDANMPALLSAALRERESAKDAERLRELLVEARSDWIKVGYAASHEDVAECRDFCKRVDAAIAAEKGERT